MNEGKENGTSTGKRLLESLRGEVDAESESLVVSEDRPPMVSFELQSGMKLALSYIRIDAVWYEGGEIRIISGERRITLRGDKLQAVYNALQLQRALRIIELATQDGWGEEGADAAYVDEIRWDSDFDH